jgi:hypothetical protein
MRMVRGFVNDGRILTQFGEECNHKGSHQPESEEDMYIGEACIGD